MIRDCGRPGKSKESFGESHVKEHGRSGCIVMNPPLYDKPTFSGMSDYRPGVPQSRVMDQSPAGGTATTNPHLPLDQQTMDFWQYQQASLGQREPSTANPAQQPSYPMPSSDIHTNPMIYEDAAQTHATYHDDTTYAHHPVMQQQMNHLGQYGLPFSSDPQNVAATTSTQNGHTRYQPSNGQFVNPISGIQPSEVTYTSTFKAPKKAPTAQPIAFGNALNVATFPQNPSATIPFQEDAELSGLAHAQEFMTWINHDDNGRTTMSSHIPTSTLNEPAMTPTFVYGQMPDHMIWQNPVTPSQVAQGPSRDQFMSDALRQYQHNTNQNQSMLQLQMQTSAPATSMQASDNNAIMNANTTNSMQTQLGNQLPTGDECMQMFLWNQESYPETSQGASSMPNQQPSFSDQQAQQQNPTHNEPTGLARKANTQGSARRPPMFAIPAPKVPQSAPQTQRAATEAQAQYNVDLPQTVAHHAAPIFRQNHVPAQPHSKAGDNGQFMAYAIPAPVESANSTRKSLMGRSEAYHQHSAIAGKLEVLALETNPSHSAGILWVISGYIAKRSLQMSGLASKRPNLELYMTAASRYAAGERKITIHTPRVGQKSYGTEKR